MLALLNAFGLGRFLAWVGKSATAAAVLDWFLDKSGALAGYASSLSYWLFPGLWEKAYTEYHKDVETAARIASGPATAIVRAMTDMPISADMLAKIGSGGLSAADRDKIGDWFVDVLDQIFQEDPIAVGYKNREPGTQERLAFRRFVGRNAQLQLSGVMIDLIKDRLPRGLTVGLGEIAERMEKILGFEDSQEEIMEPLMEKIIITGMEKRYNRLIKPTDYTTNDAIGLFIRGTIDRALMDKVLNNEGIMDDTRENLIQLQAKNLSQSDVQDSYNWGDATPASVLAYFRGQGYLQDDAEDKAHLVNVDRRRKLLTELANIAEQQAVKSIITEGDYSGILRQNGYKDDEIQISVDMVRRKKTLGAKSVAKRITGSFNITPERVKEGDHAIIKWNIRNADTITITDLGTVAARGEQPLAVTGAKTYTLTARNEAGEEEEFIAYVEVRGAVEAKLPRVSFSLSPRSGDIASVRELRWHVTGADTVTVQGVPVAAQGVQFLAPVIPTFYTLRATNSAGTVVEQDVALVTIPDIFGDDPGKPTVTFAISPLVVDAKQPQIEIRWTTTHSESERLIYPDGHSINLTHNGAMLETITESGVFTFEATNDRGTTRRQEAVIFKGPPPEEPPPPGYVAPPTVSLSAFPQTIAPGAMVNITWYVAGADNGTLTDYQGATFIVGQSGSRQFSMPTTLGTYTFHLSATNLGGTATADLPIVVSG